MKSHSESYIILKLRQSIYVTGITIEYIEPYLIANQIQSAPKTFALELSKNNYKYDKYKNCSDFTYNPMVDGGKKLFDCPKGTNEAYQYAKFIVLENYGASYTCLYRIQIHGKVPIN